MFYAVTRAESVDGNGALAGGPELRPQHAAGADRHALGDEGPLVTNMESVAAADLPVEVERGCEGFQRIQHRRNRHARFGDRGLERLRDGAADRDLTGERQQLARRLVVGLRRRDRTEQQGSGERRDER